MNSAPVQRRNSAFVFWRYIFLGTATGEKTFDPACRRPLLKTKLAPRFLPPFTFFFSYDGSTNNRLRPRAGMTWKPSGRRTQTSTSKLETPSPSAAAQGVPWSTRDPPWFPRVLPGNACKREDLVVPSTSMLIADTKLPGVGKARKCKQMLQSCARRASVGTIFFFFCLFTTAPKSYDTATTLFFSTCSRLS